VTWNGTACTEHEYFISCVVGIQWKATTTESGDWLPDLQVSDLSFLLLGLLLEHPFLTSFGHARFAESNVMRLSHLEEMLLHWKEM